jgi:CRP-like cAMP-binding protein
MILHFKYKYPQLNLYWDKYLEFQRQIKVPAKAILLREGELSRNYIFIEQGCVRAFINNNGKDKTIQFFFENEGLTSFESFVNNTASICSIETLEPCVLYLLPKKYVNKLMQELCNEPFFINIILKISAERQLHYMREFVSFIRDSADERYQKLLSHRPHIIQRVPQHYIASYLAVSKVHLSRIKAALLKKSRK